MMDETTPTASFALVSSKSSPPSAPKRSLPTSPDVGEGGRALYAEGLQTRMGRTFNGGSIALPEESLAPVVEDE